MFLGALGSFRAFEHMFIRALATPVAVAQPTVLISDTEPAGRSSSPDSQLLSPRFVHGREARRTSTRDYVFDPSVFDGLVEVLTEREVSKTSRHLYQTALKSCSLMGAWSGPVDRISQRLPPRNASSAVLILLNSRLRASSMIQARLSRLTGEREG